jgi:hypothetical protein
MFDQFHPGATHTRLWPSLVVIASIGAVGLAMLLVLN